MKLWGVTNIKISHLEDTLNGNAATFTCQDFVPEIGPGNLLINCPNWNPSIPECTQYISALRICSKCSPGYRLRISQVVDNYPSFYCELETTTCAANEYLNGGVCEPCNGPSGKPGCQTCSKTASIFSCSACLDTTNWTLVGSILPYPCKKTCPSGEKIQIDGITCRQCSAITTGCLTCQDYRDNCDSCIPGSYLSSNLCANCPAGCLSCTSTQCGTCETGKYLDISRPFAQQCQSCTIQFCDACSLANNLERCDTCQSGFTYDQSLRICKRNCDPGAHISWRASDNTCVDCRVLTPDCVTCSPTTQLCTGCPSYYYLKPAQSPNNVQCLTCTNVEADPMCSQCSWDTTNNKAICHGCHTTFTWKADLSGKFTCQRNCYYSTVM